MLFNGVFMSFLASPCYHMVQIGTLWETSPPLRIRYAPRPEILMRQGFPVFYILPYPQPYPHLLHFPYPQKTAMPCF